MSVSGLSVVVPVYKSEQTLVELVRELEAQLRRLVPEFEIILVNDDSPDGSWAVIENLAREHSFVHGIDLMGNSGQHNALLAGIRAARFPVIVTMDDDLQHPPSEIHHLLAPLDQGYDVVYGTPQDEKHDFTRRIASRIIKLALQSAMGAATARSISAFRAFRTELRAAFASYTNPFVSIDVLLTWGTRRFTGVPVRHEPRRVGKSNYTVRKLFTHAANLVTGFSALPLRLATLIGFLFTLFGIAVLGFVIVRYLTAGTTVPGFPFLASIIAIFSGAQMFALGIIGEYLGRMHGRLLDRAPYTIRSQVGAAGAPAAAAAPPREVGGTR
jgi:undecaprenyl-phosphate 4-deoxy-4-formamido-L-arabinose transferase